jgi:DNA polymerase II
MAQARRIEGRLMLNGFLLTRQWLDGPSGIQLNFWMVTDQGPIQLAISHQKAIFFVREIDAERISQLIAPFKGVELKVLTLNTFEGQSVCGLYFDAQQTLYRVREKLQIEQIPCYESDIRPAERFLFERFIMAGATIEANYPEQNEVLENPRLQPSDYRPDLNLMSVDIETDYQTDALFSIAYVTRTESKTLMIGSGSDDVNIEYVSDESILIRRWVEQVKVLDPDVFIGWNVVNFDFMMLQKRSARSSVPLALGRDGSIPRWRKSQADPNINFIAITGRVVLDGIDTLKSATFNFPSFALDAVANDLLGRGKLIDDKSRHDPLYKAKEIRRQFAQDKPSLAAYNLEDCQLVWEVFEKADLINFAVERAHLTGLEMDRAGGSVAAFENLYLPRLHRKGFIAPNIGDYQGELSAPGGYVMDSEPGLHDSVLVLDYKSLYPSIIRTFLIDPYGRIVAKTESEENIVEGYDGASFSKQEHILPGLIAGLWQARDRAKHDNNAALSQAIKIIMNSFYGVLGTSGCRLHDSRLTSSITKRGHDIILKTVELIEAEGFNVIYGDTDSVFVSLGGSFDNDYARQQGERLSMMINQYWDKTLQSEFGIESCLEMEVETHFSQFFMPTMRGSELGSKKRYAGLVRDDDGIADIRYKGLETVRTDWTELAREFQRVLFQKLFDHENCDAIVRDTALALRAGEFDDKLIYRKRLRKKLSEYQKNVPPHAQAAIKAEATFRERGIPPRYQNKSWIEYVITQSGAEALECQSSALDYDHYIEKQLTPIADTILNAIGSSVESILQQQQELF